MVARMTVVACVLVMACAGCRTKKPVQAPLPPVVLNSADSVTVEKILGTVYEAIEVAVDLPRQSETNVTRNDSSHVETDLAFSDAWISEDGVLHHLIENKPGQLKGNAFVPHTTERSNREAVKIKEVPVPEPYPVEVERELTRWEKAKMEVGGVAMGVVVAMVIAVGVWGVRRIVNR